MTTPPTPQDVREIGARALYRDGDPIGEGFRWDEQPDSVQDFYRRRASAVLAAVEPVIRQQERSATDARLAAAELVCDLYGITGVRSDSPRDKAATQAWLDWSRDYGDGRPLPTAELIAELAAQRDAIREATLAKIQERHPEIAAIARSHSTREEQDHG